MSNMSLIKKYWVYLLVATLPFERLPSLNVPTHGHSITIRLSYIVAILGIVIFFKPLIHALKAKWTSPQFWILGYLFVTVLSTIAALDPTRAALALVASIIALGTGLVVAQVVRVEQMSTIHKVLGIVTAAVCLFGLYQFLGDSLGLSPGLTGLTPNYTHQVFGFPRLQSTGLEPLFFGNFLLIPFGLTLARTLAGRWNKWYLLLLLLIATTMTLTLSRGTFYAAAAGAIGLGVMLLRRPNWRSSAVAFGAILAGVGIAIGLIVGVTTLHPYNGRGGEKALQQFTKQSTTVAATATSADSDRVVNRRLALDAFKSRPLIGYGLGNFGAYVQHTHPSLYGPSTPKVVVNNEYLEILAETGIAGALALLAFALTLAWAVFKRLIFASSEDRIWILGLSAVAGGFVVQYNAFSTLYIMHIWVALGLLMALCHREKVQIAEHKLN